MYNDMQCDNEPMNNPQCTGRGKGNEQDAYMH